MVVTVVAFATLCVVSLRRGIAVRGASVWLAVSFASLAIAGLLVPQLDDGATGTGSFLALMAMAGGLLVHPVALMQFAHTLQPVSAGRRVRLAVVAGLLFVATGIVAAVDPQAFGDASPASPAGTAVLVTLSAVWLGVDLFVGARLVRFGQRLTSSVGRARARTMAAGVLGLAPAVAVPFLVPGLDESSGALFALAACVVIAAGYLPPRWLRWTWARGDTRRLTDVELAVLRDPSMDLTPWLATVRAVWDADAVWLEVDGITLEAVGTDDPPPSSDEPSGGDDVHVRRSGLGAWVLSAWVPGGRLTARTAVDPVLLDEVSDLFLATAGRLRSAATRRALEARERADEARRQAVAHEAEASRLRDDVLSTLSHELRTPLVTLRGVPELLLRRWEELADSDVRLLLQRVQDNALSLHRMVEATLLLAQLRAHEVRARPTTQSAADVVDEALQRLQRVGVEVGRVDASQVDGAAVHTDPRLAGAVLAELVHNALTYSDAPTAVRVSTQPVHDGVEVVVVDQGRGLAGEEHRRLLEAFTRQGDVLTRDRRGLGIGLTLVGELAPLLGARLDVRSDPGRGTEVHLRLPAPVGATGHASTPATPVG